MYELRIDKQVAKYLKKLDKPNRKRLMGALMELAENPSDTSVTRMKGYMSTLITSRDIRTIRRIIFG